MNDKEKYIKLQKDVQKMHNFKDYMYNLLSSVIDNSLVNEEEFIKLHTIMNLFLATDEEVLKKHCDDVFNEWLANMY